MFWTWRWALLNAIIIYEVQAVYRTYYVEDICGKGSVSIAMGSSGEESTGILRATRKASYSQQLRCNLLLVAPASYYVVLSIREVSFRINLDGSCKDFVEIHGVGPICNRPLRLDESESYNSVGHTPPNVLNVVYLTTGGLDNRTLTGYSGFSFTFTAVYRPTGSECLGNSSFRCARGEFCIWNGLRCDGHNNCGDLSDEEDCGGGGSTVLIVLALLIVCLLFIMCTATLIYTRNERVRRLSHRLRAATFSFVQRRPR